VQVPLEQIVTIGYNRAIVASLMPAGFKDMGLEAGGSLAIEES